MATVTCKTEGCGNEGIPLSVNLSFVDDDGETQYVDAVMCGVCGQPITDVTADERQTQ
jgi:hypothetical protein